MEGDKTVSQDAERPGTDSARELPTLNLRRLETFQRLLQYGAFLVLLVFLGLIALSWFQLRRINNEIAAADADLNQKRLEIDKLRIDADKLRAENGGLQKVNGALTDVTRSIGGESPEQAEKIKQVVEESIGSSATDLTQIPARIYMHIGNAEQRRFAAAIANRLQAQGYIVPGIENVHEKAPLESDIRYYASDAATMKDVQDIQANCLRWGLKLTVPRNPVSSHSVRPRHYEIWFGKNAAQNPTIDLGPNPPIKLVPTTPAKIAPAHTPK